MCEQSFLTFSNICILSLFDVLVKDPHRLELIKVTLFKLSSLEPFSKKKCCHFNPCCSQSKDNCTPTKFASSLMPAKMLCNSMAKTNLSDVLMNDQILTHKQRLVNPKDTLFKECEDSKKSVAGSKAPKHCLEKARACLLCIFLWGVTLFSSTLDFFFPFFF